MDLAFVRLYLNDFTSALQGDDSNAVTIAKGAYIQLLPCGKISQFSDCKDGVVFVGGIKVELIDSCGTVLEDVTNFFAYDTFVKDGLPQINWEFGKTGKDYYFKRLFLKITDLINENVYYSSGFIMTSMDSELSTEFVYREIGRFRGIPYDLKDFYQRIRFYKCYYKDSSNVSNLKEYTQTDGKIANYRDVPTYGKKFIFDKLDIAIDNRINQMFAHSILYANEERMKLISYEPNEVVGDTNWKTATFNLNPQGGYFTLPSQIFQDFKLLDYSPKGNYTVDNFPAGLYGQFTTDIILGIGTIKIFDEFNTLITTFTQDDIAVASNYFEVDNSAFVKTIKGYYVIISEGLFKGVGCSEFKITSPSEWTFEIRSAQYNKPQYSEQYS